MKLITLSLLLFCFTNFSFAQTKKELQKEITNYRTNVYVSAQYETGLIQFTSVLKSYFLKEKFKQQEESDSLLLPFSKLVYLSCNENPNFNASNYGGTRGKCKVTAIVSVEIITNDEYKKIKITTEHREYNRPFNKDFSQKSILGNYKFNKTELYKYLYHRLVSKEVIPLPEALINKIKNYNSQQTKEKNKLIAGRDY